MTSFTLAQDSNEKQHQKLYQSIAGAVMRMAWDRVDSQQLKCIAEWFLQHALEVPLY